MDLVETTARPLEHRHPWESVRAAFFLRVLEDEGLLRPEVTVLDVGAGDGWLAARVAAAGGTTITCWDTGYDEAKPPPRPSLRFVERPPPGERFALALILDVLEHVEDDAGFLTSVVNDRLEPGGTALLSVPAWPALFSEHDRRLRHRRRYAPAGARALAEAAGLQVVRSGGLFHSLLLARGVQLARERLLAPSAPPAHAGEWRHGTLVTRIVSTLLLADASVSRLASHTALDLPGLSWWALCRRPS